jgi:hypothetical protein
MKSCSTRVQSGVIQAIYRIDGGRRSSMSSPSTLAAPASASRCRGRPWQQRRFDPPGSRRRRPCAAAPALWVGDFSLRAPVGADERRGVEVHARVAPGFHDARSRLTAPGRRRPVFPRLLRLPPPRGAARRLLDEAPSAGSKGRLRAPPRASPSCSLPSPPSPPLL